MAGMSRRTAAGLAAGVAIAILAVDQASKAWARAALPRGQLVSIVNGWLWFRRVTNSGATFGLLSGNNELFIVLSLAVVLAVGMLVFQSQAPGALGVSALGAIAGGGFSNLLDRVRFGSVTDFIIVPVWPTNFNLADAAIRIGVVLFIVALLLEMRRDRRPG
jgi:signal peptidase II